MEQKYFPQQYLITNKAPMIREVYVFTRIYFIASRQRHLRKKSVHYSFETFEIIFLSFAKFVYILYCVI